MAASISSPSTNWLPISRMARRTAVRITGSPSRRTAPRSVEATPGCMSSRRTRPVSISAHVEALTRGDDDLPRCAPHSDGAILSSISASIVSASGTRKSASARHISAMPSSVDSPYSARNTSIRPGRVSARIRSTHATACAVAALRASADIGGGVQSRSRTPASSARCKRCMASRNGLRSAVGFGSLIMMQACSGGHDKSLPENL